MAENLTIEPNSGALGARVTGVDLGASLDKAVVEAIIRAWLDHIVLVFPGQELNQEQQLAFARHFGETGARARKAEERPEGADLHEGIMLITNDKDENGEYVGSLPDGEMFFHHDMCYVRSPHKATMLYGIAIPPDGGDTKFANMYRAYDQISEALKQELRGRTALQTYNYSPTEIPDVDGDLTDIHHLSQPVFVTNPESGRTALYVNRLMTARIDGMSKDESDPILEQLFDIIERPENVLQHKWTPGDLVMWDNRCSCHARTDFAPGHRRHLRRCTVQGGPMIAAA
ncbi:MAG: TauD/TfdA family dioxygenase [Pseudomonadota bacterium]|nr:TauD/TfdA family dioxygenase [Pseudomonadota bacterium]